MLQISSRTMLAIERPWILQFPKKMIGIQRADFAKIPTQGPYWIARTTPDKPTIWLRVRDGDHDQGNERAGA